MKATELFPFSIPCAKPKMTNHRGRTWDTVKVYSFNNEKVAKGYLDTSWGHYVYFEYEGKWRKILHNPGFRHPGEGKIDLNMDFCTLKYINMNK